VLVGHNDLKKVNRAGRVTPRSRLLKGSKRASDTEILGGKGDFKKKKAGGREST